MIKFKRLTKTSVIPTRATTSSAGLDLYADLGEGSIVIQPHSTNKVGTGLAMELPGGFAGFIFARSGLASKEGLRPANCVGLIDSDYRGELIVALHNDTDEAKMIAHGDRVAQLVVMETPIMEIEEVDELEETSRSSGGFGSTGK